MCGTWQADRVLWYNNTGPHPRKMSEQSNNALLVEQDDKQVFQSRLPDHPAYRRVASRVFDLDTKAAASRNKTADFFKGRGGLTPSCVKAL